MGICLFFKAACFIKGVMLIVACWYLWLQILIDQKTKQVHRILKGDMKTKPRVHFL